MIASSVIPNGRFMVLPLVTVVPPTGS
jgi:hypothetical protein